MNEEKLITKYKKFKYNFFWNRSECLGILIFILGLTPFYEVSEQFGLSDTFFWVSCLFAAVVMYILYKKIRSKKGIDPYKKSNHFVGIYNIDDLNGSNKEYYDEKLISRVHEVEYLKKILGNISEQGENKQSICIIGESGSGKSTIINRLQTEIDNDYRIINCSDRYKDLKQYLLKKFKKETLQDIFDNLLLTNEKVIFVFDQFERFFFLDYKEQVALKKEVLNKLNIKNVASIFVLRSDFFAKFVYNISINNISYDEIISNGILINSYNSGWYTNNYLLYCKNEVDEDFPELEYGKEKEAFENREESICKLCQCSFDDFHNEIYNRFKNRRLIEKQIFLNLLENEYEHRSGNDFAKFLNQNNDRELIIKYYDRQLCNTGYYHISVKIMYLLSTGRIYNQNFSLHQIYEALLASKRHEIENVNASLEKLSELKLIKLTQRDDINYYEIVHDYIAESFIEYAEVELHEYMKSTLDDFRVNYKNNEYINGVDKCLENKCKNKYFETIILIIVLVSITLTSLYRVGKLNDGYNMIINIPLYLASYYGYCLYTNIFKLFSEKNKFLLKILYVCMAICAVLACVLDVYWLAFSGVGTIFIGFSFGVIRGSKKISGVARKFYTDFWGKVTTTGCAIFVCSIFFILKNYDVYMGVLIILLELIYAYIAQLSEEYYYYCVGFMNSRHK